MRQALRNKLAFSGAVIILAMACIAILAPLIAPYDPGHIDTDKRLLGPSMAHLFGTDQLGRDVFSRMVYGARISLTIGLVAVGIEIFIGIIIGAIAGYYGGKTDAFLMRFVDLMLCFPSFFLILAVISILEPNILNVMIVIGITSWMGVARLIRGQILSVKEREFIEAARATGASDARIILRHLIPNSIGPVLVSATLGVGAAVLIEASLSFLGLGVQPPTPSWGNILTEGKSTLGVAWWLMLYPGLAVLIAVLGFNLLGEGLREHLNPRRRQ